MSVAGSLFAKGLAQSSPWPEPRSGDESSEGCGGLEWVTGGIVRAAVGTPTGAVAGPGEEAGVA